MRLWHASSGKNRASIEASGLRAGEAGVWFYSDFERVRGLRRAWVPFHGNEVEDQDIWEATVEDSDLVHGTKARDQWSAAEHDPEDPVWVCYRDVPPSRLRRVDADTGRPLVKAAGHLPGGLSVTAARTYFHASPHRLEPGAVLRPGGGPKNFGTDGDSDWVYMSESESDAWTWGRLMALDVYVTEAPHIYIYAVEPVGRVKSEFVGISPSSREFRTIQEFMVKEARVIRLVADFAPGLQKWQSKDPSIRPLGGRIAVTDRGGPRPWSGPCHLSGGRLVVAKAEPPYPRLPPGVHWEVGTPSGEGVWIHFSTTGQLVSDPLHAGNYNHSADRYNQLSNIDWRQQGLDDAPAHWRIGRRAQTYALRLKTPLANPGRPLTDREAQSADPTKAWLYVNEGENSSWGSHSVVAPLRAWEVVAIAGGGPNWWTFDTPIPPSRAPQEAEKMVAYRQQMSAWDAYWDAHDASKKTSARQTYYRLHHRSAPWSLTPTSQEFRQNLYDKVRRNVGEAVPGYSSFDNPWHLWDYVMRRRWEYDASDVAVFTGTEVGRGVDDEPLVTPSGQPTKRMSWAEFQDWLQTQPMGSPPAYKGGGYDRADWGDPEAYLDRVLRDYDRPGWERWRGVREVTIGQTDTYGGKLPAVWFVRGRADGKTIKGGFDTEQEARDYAAQNGLTVASALSRTASEDYWGHHRAPSGEDDVAAPFHDVEMMMPDYYDRPSLYSHDRGQVDRECAQAIRAARGKPEALVTIYRALPPGFTSINTGDWVTPSLAYARQHAVSNGEDDWPVISARVPARTLWTEGYAAEWGYSGPPVTARLAKVAADQDYSDSVMLCLRPPEEVRDLYAGMDVTTEERDNLHITLAYLGSTEEAGGEMGRERLFRACYDMAIHSGLQHPEGKVNGFGCFMNDDTNVLISLWDIPEIAEFRTELLAYCQRHGAPLRKDDHGFTPHMTLAYADKPFLDLPELPEGNPERVSFGSIWLVWGEDWQEIPLA